MEKDRNDKDKVTKGDVEFALFLAEAEDEKTNGKNNFVIPSHIFRVYIENSTKDYEEVDLEDENVELVYNVYITVDGMYFMAGQFNTRSDAERFAENTSIKFEKKLKYMLTLSLNASMQGDTDE